MPDNALNCPNCGASVTDDEVRCRYCSTRLAKIACPNCFGMMFVGSKFCAHCGVTLQAPCDVDEPHLICVDCNAPMRPLRLGATIMQECERCHGLWIDTESFQRIGAESERQTDILGAVDPTPPEPIARVIPMVRYRACPVCNRLMNRSNFANSSRIVTDVCKSHGIWFDRDELRQVIEFIRAGGAEKAKQRQREHDAAKKRWNDLNRRSAADDVSWQHGRVGHSPL